MASGPPAPDAPRPRLTGRAAILAVVVCAIALSIAYPLREYFAQRRQIAQYEAQERAVAARVQALAQRRQQVTDPAYVTREARRRLHYCFPDQRCYIVVGSGTGPTHPTPDQAARRTPWFATLWRSVEQADATGR